MYKNTALSASAIFTWIVFNISNDKISAFVTYFHHCHHVSSFPPNIAQNCYKGALGSPLTTNRYLLNGSNFSDLVSFTLFRSHLQIAIRYRQFHYPSPPRGHSARFIRTSLPSVFPILLRSSFFINLPHNFSKSISLAVFDYNSKFLKVSCFSLPFQHDVLKLLRTLKLLYSPWYLMIIGVIICL
jgi:hypothetical protein